MMKKESIARTVREHALTLIAQGQVAEVSGHRVSTWKDERFQIMLTTPFSKLQGIGANYVLDIWDGGKVLSIGWDRGEDLEIRSFKRRGQWEAAFLAAR